MRDRTILLLLAGGLVALEWVFPPPAIAASEHSLGGTLVRLQPPSNPACPRGTVADVTFDNRAVNDPADDSVFPLERGDVSLSVTFIWNTNRAGDDEIVIETDPSHIVVPRRLTVAEGEIGTACVLPLEGVGM